MPRQAANAAHVAYAPGKNVNVPSNNSPQPCNTWSPSKVIITSTMSLLAAFMWKSKCWMPCLPNCIAPKWLAECFWLACFQSLNFIIRPSSRAVQPIAIAARPHMQGTIAAIQYNADHDCPVVGQLSGTFVLSCRSLRLQILNVDHWGDLFPSHQSVTRS